MIQKQPTTKTHDEASSAAPEGREHPRHWDAADREEHVQRAVAGDAAATEFVLRHRESFPEADERVGNPAHQALESIIRLIAGTDHARAQSIRDECERYRRELLSDEPHRLEYMAVDTVLVSWVYVHYLFQGSPGRPSMSPTNMLKSQREAQRCLDGALRSLELVRSKLTPAAKGKLVKTPAPNDKADLKPTAEKESGPKKVKLKIRRPK